jgi:hypothetical protein
MASVFSRVSPVGLDIPPIAPRVAFIFLQVRSIGPCVGLVARRVIFLQVRLVLTDVSLVLPKIGGVLFQIATILACVALRQGGDGECEGGEYGR